MKIVFLLILLSPLSAMACAELLDHKVRELNGDKQVHLCEEYKHKVVLIVNTASRCGYTNQYDGLEKLYDRYKAQGLVVLGFPSNDFAAQEPGSEKEIQSFCRLTYGVQFPMFAKTRVSRYSADPLYKGLAKESGNFPAWNFHKYLVNRKGNLIADYASAVEPLGNVLVSDIENALKQKF